MNKIYIFVTALLCSTLSYAGLITHTDYNSGAIISAAGQNTNENTIYNEFNGNIDNTNIKAGGILNANIADNNVAIGKMDTVFQSSFTTVQNMFHYRRPTLQWLTTTTVKIASGTYTDSNTWVMFPDGNLRNDGTAARVVLTISQVASLSGSWQSGLRTGTVATNTWYAVYAVKTTDDANKFVAVADTVLPITANYATLNSNFGTNGWVYIGMIRYGDGANTNNAILRFWQSGSHTVFFNVNTGGTTNYPGMTALATGDVTSQGYAPGQGTSGNVIPNNILFIDLLWGSNSGGVAATLQDGGNSIIYGRAQGTANAVALNEYTAFPITLGAQINLSGTAHVDALIVGFWDNVLTSSNPLF